jgi:Tfx family DNA-binding protein
MTGDDEIETADRVLDRLGFDPEDSVLTRRQAEVLALRERGLSQADIAERLGTSRANVSGVESSARENVRKARETVAFADALSSPVSVEIDPGTDLYDVPRRVFGAADEAELKVTYTAPELMATISDAAGDAIRERTVREPLVVGVARDGDVRVRRHRSRE